MFALRVGLVSACVAASWAYPGVAGACGGFFCDNLDPVVQTAERILFRVNADNTVTTIVEIQYEGPPSQFGWVLPISPGLTVEDLGTEPGPRGGAQSHEQGLASPLGGDAGLPGCPAAG